MAERVSVLVVDDEQSIADSYEAHLESEYDVSVAYSGEEALETADEETDVVLLDRRMPEMSGDEVLGRIDERGLGCRVIMVTAVDPDLDIIEMPFDEYLTKPVTGDQLRETIQRMLARESQEVQIQEMFALASKLATLEAKLDYEQLEESDEYQEILAEFREMQREGGLPDSMDDPYLEATLEKMQALLDHRQA